VTRKFQFIVLALASAALVGGAQAQSPREQLNQMAQQLQTSPNDNALRERIIQLAVQIKPPPAIPVEALKLMGKGEYLVREAKRPEDFLAAAEAFREAAKLAPWDAAAYFNQGIAYERAQRAELAIAAFNWYLKMAAGAADTADVIKRLGGLEVAAQSQARARDRAAALRYQYDRIKFYADGKMYGNWLTCHICTKRKSEGANWDRPGFNFVLTASVALYEDSDPRIELSFVQTGDQRKYNGLNYVFIGRPAEGSKALRWKLKSRAWGAQDKSWWNDESPTWLYVSETGMRWCGTSVGSECERVPLGASDPWNSTDPSKTYMIYSVRRR